MRQRNVYRCSVELPTGEPPAAFRVFAFGTFKALWRDGTEKDFTFDAESARSVIAAFQKTGRDRLFLDYEHDSEKAFVSGPKPASGWFVPEAREDGLYAVVEWTERASSMLRAREYRFVSPVFRTDKDGRVISLFSIALTNDPATVAIAPLVASANGTDPNAEEPEMLTAILAALGLAENASEADVTKQIESLKSEAAKAKTEAELCALTGKTVSAESMAVVQAWKQGAEQVAALNAKIAEFEKAAAEAAQKAIDAERDALIKAALSSGQLVPATEPWAKAQTVEALKAFLAVAPKVVPIDEPVRQPPPAQPTASAAKAGEVDVKALSAKGWDAMTSWEKHLLHNADREAYEAAKKAAKPNK